MFLPLLYLCNPYVLTDGRKIPYRKSEQHTEAVRSSQQRQSRDVAQQLSMSMVILQ